jgi:hypothetical protein
MIDLVQHLREARSDFGLVWFGFAVVYRKRARGASLRRYRRSLSSGLGLSGSGSGDGLGLWPNSGDITMYLRGIPSRSSGVRIDSLGGVSFDFALKNFLNSVNTTCTDAGYSS